MDKANKEMLFLKQVMTEDEKLIIYNNIERKRYLGKWKKLLLSILMLVIIRRKSGYGSDGIGN